MAKQFLVQECACGQGLKIDTDGPADFTCPNCKRELTVNFYMGKGYVLETKETGV